MISKAHFRQSTVVGIACNQKKNNFKLIKLSDFVWCSPKSAAPRTPHPAPRFAMNTQLICRICMPTVCCCLLSFAMCWASRRRILVDGDVHKGQNTIIRGVRYERARLGCKCDREVLYLISYIEGGIRASD